VIPARIQLSRRKGWRMPENTVKVDRTTAFGNPFVVRGDDFGRAAAVAAFKVWLLAPTLATPFLNQRQRLINRLPELRGKNLGCWCPRGAPCHADVLLDLANAPARKLDKALGE
jgi:hypothetical protein